VGTTDLDPLVARHRLHSSFCGRVLKKPQALVHGEHTGGGHTVV
jgi:hypothetical protein